MANQKYTKQIGDDVLYDVEAMQNPTQAQVKSMQNAFKQSYPETTAWQQKLAEDVAKNKAAQTAAYAEQLKNLLQGTSMGLGQLMTMEPPKITPNTKSVILVLEVQVPKDVPAHIVAELYTPHSEGYVTECSYKDVRYHPSAKVLSVEEQDLSSVDDTKGGD